MLNPFDEVFGLDLNDERILAFPSLQAGIPVLDQFARYLNGNGFGAMAFRVPAGCQVRFANDDFAWSRQVEDFFYFHVRSPNGRTLGRT